MIKNKWLGRMTALLMAVAVLFVGFALVVPDAFASISEKTDPAYVAAMDKTEIMSFEIVTDEAQWADMLENATAEEYIPATVVINGTKIENVGIRPKGNSSLSTVAADDTTDRFSFKIEFDHYITGQNWLGLDKIVINNMQGDATYMKEYLSYDIMEYVGVEAPLFAFADISVNGASWGFYLAVEALDDSYATRVYGNGHGKLYKPESMGMRGAGQMNEFIENAANEATPEATTEATTEAATVQEPGAAQSQQNRMGGGMGGMSSSGVSLEYVDDAVDSYSAIFDNAVFDTSAADENRVVDALYKLSQGEDLENTVDVEAVLKYFAAHTVVVNLDSYVTNMGHNYYLYEQDGQLTILPWDYNLSFGGFQSSGASAVVNFPIDTPVSGVSLEERPLLGKLLEVPEYAALYHSYLQDIVTGYFDSGVFEQTIDTMNALIASHVEADPTAFNDYTEYESGIVELKELGLLRAESIARQLDGTVPSTTEAQSANSASLIDASSVNLSALGSQGGGGERNMGGTMGGEQGGAMGGMGGMDREVMQQAMVILQEAGENELTEEQQSALDALGLTEEQITQIKTMAQGDFGGRGGGQRPESAGDATAGASQSFGTETSSLVEGYDTSTWILIGVCTLLIVAGLAFAMLFRRRRST